jgi:malate synthase
MRRARARSPVSATTGTSSPAEVRAPVVGRDAEILTPEVLAFRRRAPSGLARSARGCLPRARARQAELDAGALPAFLPETQAVRDGDWQVVPAPAELQDRRVEITGPSRPQDGDQRGGRFAEAREIFERVALGDDFVEFLTLPAYDYID